MNKTDDVAGRHADAFVHCLVHTAVRLGDDTHLKAGMSGAERFRAHLVLKFADDVHRTVGGGAVNDDVLYVRIVLTQNALDGAADGSLAVVARGYYGYLHVFIIHNFIEKK